MNNTNHLRTRLIGARRFAFWADALRVSVWLIVGVLICLSAGCRAFRDRSSHKQLDQARQLSLRGADALQRKRDYDAELLFSEALKQSPADERAHWGYASTLWKRGDRTKAIEHMEEALRLSGSNSSQNPEYAIRLGEMNLELGNYLEARENAKSVLAENRSNAAAWALLGESHAAERDWPPAVECFQRALLIQGDYPKVQLALADAYRVIGKPQRSLAVLDHMVDLDETARHDPNSLLTRGLAMAALNRNSEAAEILQMASERLPIDQVQKHLQIVHAQHRIGELVAARVSLGRVRESHASNSEVQRLQSILDMSFAHLTDPVKPIKEPGWGGAEPPAAMVSARENWIHR